jgi:tRNA dimethylallyltransferase
MNRFYRELLKIDIQNIDLDVIKSQIDQYINTKTPSKKVIVITGPTVSGKTALSLEIAKHYHFEVISADSRQIYESMDIGSNKVDIDYVQIYRSVKSIMSEGIPHFMIDIIKPGERFSVFDFVDSSRKIINSNLDDKKIPLIVGGTGYYIKSLIDGINVPFYEKELSVITKLRETDFETQKQMLLDLDPKANSLLDLNNPRRVQNALEHILTTNLKYSDFINSPNISGGYDALIIRLEAPSELLYANADIKLDYRINLGLVDEVKSLINSGIDTEWLKSIGLEYKYVTRFIQGEYSRDEMREKLAFAIHHYIKRQKTYFNKYL